jgi:hypothetical protein
VGPLKRPPAGELKLPREDILFFATPHAGEVSVNSTRVTRVLGTDVWDLSYAESQSRRQMRQISQFLKRYVPGFEKAYVMQSGVNIGVRETRRILGEYQLTVDDVLNARKFDDAIARGAYPVDIHNPKGVGTVLKRLPPGEAYDIPMRCLLPQRTDRLIVAGRCISGTHEAHSSYRVMPIVMATGQPPVSLRRSPRAVESVPGKPPSGRFSAARAPRGEPAKELRPQSGVGHEGNIIQRLPPQPHPKSSV